MGAYRALSDSVRELNRMLIGQQEFNGQMELERAKIEANNKERMEQAKDRALQRELTQHKVDQIREYKTPTDFSFHQAMPAEILAIPGMHENISKMLDPDGSLGVTMDLSTGKPMTKDGQLLISPEKMEDILPGIMSLASAHANTPQRALEQATVLGNQIKTLESEMAEWNKDKGHNLAKIVEGTKALNALKKQHAEASSFFTPKKMVSYYGDQAAQMNRAALWAKNKGMKDSADWFTNKAREFSKNKSEALNQVMKNSAATKAKTYKPDLVKWYDKDGNEVGHAWVQAGEDPSAYGFDREKGHSLTRPHKKGEGSKYTVGQMIDDIDRKVESQTPLGMKFTEAEVTGYRNAWQSIAFHRSRQGVKNEEALLDGERIINDLEGAYWEAYDLSKNMSKAELDEQLDQFRQLEEKQGNKEAAGELLELIREGNHHEKRKIMQEYALELFNIGLRAQSGGKASPYTPSGMMRKRK